MQLLKLVSQLAAALSIIQTAQAGVFRRDGAQKRSGPIKPKVFLIDMVSTPNICNERS